MIIKYDLYNYYSYTHTDSIIILFYGISFLIEEVKKIHQQKHRFSFLLLDFLVFSLLLTLLIKLVLHFLDYIFIFLSLCFSYQL